jgi:hypothetical protein
LVHETTLHGSELSGRDGDGRSCIVEPPLITSDNVTTKSSASFRQAPACTCSDHVLVNEHTPQLYGTQGASIYTDVQKAQVNARRRRFGLPSRADMGPGQGASL